jgi:hypothetical protein
MQSVRSRSSTAWHAWGALEMCRTWLGIIRVSYKQLLWSQQLRFLQLKLWVCMLAAAA